MNGVCGVCGASVRGLVVRDLKQEPGFAAMVTAIVVYLVCPGHVKQDNAQVI